MTPTLTVIIASSGRSSLGRAIHSVWQQMKPGDELILDVNNDAPWGHRARNRAMSRARGDFMLFLDDDDAYVPDALEKIRAGVATDMTKVHLFQMQYPSEEQLWHDREIREGNVSTQIIAAPRNCSGQWTDRYSGDFDFLTAVCAELGDPIWHNDVIVSFHLGEIFVTVAPRFPVVVPQPRGYEPVALWALRQEGLDPITREVDDDLGYGNLVADAWQQGGFVLVEHDIIPWWGACRELWECPEDWCVFPYPQGNGYPDPALGCCKFSDSLVAEYPTLHHDFRNAHWIQVQERLVPALWNAGRQWHIHHPPVAHARQCKDDE